MDRVVLRLGEVFSGYVIEEVLGIGGMGTVYRARDPELPRSVALKLLHRELTGDEYVRSHFESEAAHAARLEHPNVVTVYRRGRVEDQLWIAMQYVDAADAAAAIARGRIDPPRAVDIITETAKALDYAHSLGVLHRDVKPANILLEHPRPGRPGRVLLTDFGIAKALAETAFATQTGMGAFSLQYASPEQFDSQVKLDARTDVYSLGCTLFKLLTGRTPYPGTTLAHLYAGHVSGRIPKPGQIYPELSGFDIVIARALAKNRDHRYPTCEQLATAARNVIDAVNLGNPTGIGSDAGRPTTSAPQRADIAADNPVDNPPKVRRTAPVGALLPPAALAARNIATPVVVADNRISRNRVTSSQASTRRRTQILAAAMLGVSALVVGTAYWALTSTDEPATDTAAEALPATIYVGKGPHGVAVDRGAHAAYVTNNVSGTVSVIDTTTRTVTSTVKVGNGPQGVAVNPDTHIVYVANVEGTVSVIDVAGTVTGVLYVLQGAQGVAVNPGDHTAYVTNNKDDTVWVIDTIAARTTATVAVGKGPQGVAVDPGARAAYVTNSRDGTVVSIDTIARTVTATIAVGKRPQGVAVDPGARAAYVTNSRDGTVVSIDTKIPHAPGVIIAVGKGPQGVAVDPGAHTAYVTNNEDGTVSVIDTIARTVTATIAVGKRPQGVAVDSGAHTAYVTNNEDGTVSVIDTIARTVTATIAVGKRPRGVAVDSGAHTAYVTNNEDGTVSVIGPSAG